MRPSTVLLVFGAVFLFGLVGCGSNGSSSDGTGGSKQEGGATVGSVALGSGGHTVGSTGSPGGASTGGAGGAQTTGIPGSADAGVSQIPDAPMAGGSGGNSGTGDGRSTGTTAPLGGSTGSGGNTSTGALPSDAGRSADALDAAAACPGPNPASVACRVSATACVPSACGCTFSSGVLGWECTADCRTNLPVCPDAGTTPDTGTSADTRKPGNLCGKNLCSSDEYCCNPNCSQCAPTGGACTAQICQPPEIWACASDTDCTLVDDYCGGCNCRAFGPGGQLGTCGTGQADCFVAPCSMRIARCLDGVCAAVGK